MTTTSSTLGHRDQCIEAMLGHEAPKRNFPNFMKQSTIYRRHEARLARTYALRDDPRPAFVRVLSGLPGFRMILPLCIPNDGEATRERLTPATTGRETDGNYSSDTLIATTTSSGFTNDVLATRAMSTSLTSLQPAFQAMLSTAVCGGTAEFIFGSAMHSSTPFRGGRHVYSPFFAQQGNSFAVHLLRENHFSTPSVTGRQIALAAFSTSLLFGTKIYLDEQLPQQSPAFSSSCAGAAVGALQVVRTPLSMIYAQYFVLGRHILAANLYFAAYEGFKNYGDNKSDVSRLRIATAGALAGCVQATFFTMIATVGVNGNMWQCLPALVRAAPTHALIFSGYEAMKQCINESPS